MSKWIIEVSVDDTEIDNPERKLKVLLEGIPMVHSTGIEVVEIRQINDVKNEL